MSYKLYTDGGARGNPGPSAIGVVIQNSNGDTVVEFGAYLGSKTNNEAEYLALLAGLKKATEEDITELSCFLDSELVVRQLLGQYKVKNDRLLVLFNLVKDLESNFTHITYTHVPREQNKKADSLVNSTLDAQGKN